MKKKVLITVIGLILLVVLDGILKLAQYQIDMYYSKIAPRQFDDDSTYTVLKLHDSANNTADIIAVVFGIAIVIVVLKKLLQNSTVSYTQEKH